MLFAKHYKAQNYFANFFRTLKTVIGNLRILIKSVRNFVNDTSLLCVISNFVTFSRNVTAGNRQVAKR